MSMRVDARQGGVAVQGRSVDVQLVKPLQFDEHTPQTSGMRRLAAISNLLVGSEELWAGVMLAEPNTASSVHHHGPLETVVYVLSGQSKLRWGSRLQHEVDLETGDFLFIPPFMPHQEINPSPDQATQWVVVRSGREAVIVDLKESLHGEYVSDGEPRATRLRDPHSIDGFEESELSEPVQAPEDVSGRVTIDSLAHSDTSPSLSPRQGRWVSTGIVLTTGIIALLCLSVALVTSASEHPAVRKEGEKPHAAPDKVADKFVPVDTSRLMGSPDAQPTLGIEKAFPHVKFTRPVEFTNAGDGSDRVFVVEQDGLVHVFPNRPDARETKVFLDLQKVVRREHNEEGLLGLAFHPNYRTNGQFFVFYSVTPRGSVVSRFRVSKKDPDRADRDSEEKLLQFTKPYGNHNGGCLRFGPDGQLYISVGDGGLGGDPHGNAQNLESLNGKILRIDVDHKDADKNYAIPKDNPFAGRGGNVRAEIWAYGLRNVWRFSFDRQTGTLWAADVGQDRHEEVDIIVRGGNYGWNIREGKHPLDPNAERSAVGEFIEPVLDYPRVEGKSVTGGLVYRGRRLHDLTGVYLYGDFISGNVWALRWDGKKVTANPKIARTSLLISAFGEDEAGEAYFTSFDGYVYRFRAPDEKARPKHAFPRTLTETGLFASVKDHTPATGLIPYTVNVPLWSDGATKDRFLALPDKGKVVFKEKDQWEFPVGTVLVKTFLLNTDLEKPEEMRRLETRLLVHNPRGWEGYTYLWNEDQSEGNLLADWPFTREFEVKTATGREKHEWYFPSRSDCQACHTQNGGFVMGLNTRQLNRVNDNGKVKENQLRMFERLGIFDRPLPKPVRDLESFPEWQTKEAPVATLARAYLDANCAMCHSPGGRGHAGGASMDMRFHVPLRESFPGKANWLIPGDPGHSVLLKRMTMRHDNAQMPPLATNRVDEEATNILRQWVKQLPAK